MTVLVSLTERAGSLVPTKPSREKELIRDLWSMKASLTVQSMVTGTTRSGAALRDSGNVTNTIQRRLITASLR